jgi:peroxiredoxin
VRRLVLDFGVIEKRSIISLGVSFQNQSHFTTLFHRLTGVMPRTFRDEVWPRLFRREGMMVSVLRTWVAVALSLPLLIFAPPTFGRQIREPARFSFRSLDGGSVTDADLRGKVAVFVFLDSRLPVSKRQAESVRFLNHEFAPRDVVFYLVSTDSEAPGSKNYASDEAVREYGRKTDMRLPLLRDPEGKTLREYGRGQIPLVVVLDREGRVDGTPLEGFGPKGALERTLRRQLRRLTR